MWAIPWSNLSWQALLWQYWKFCFCFLFYFLMKYSWFTMLQVYTKLIQLCMRACSITSDSLQPHGLQSARFLCPWDFPGKNTGVGSHFLLHQLHIILSKLQLLGLVSSDGFQCDFCKSPLPPSLTLWEADTTGRSKQLAFAHSSLLKCPGVLVAAVFQDRPPVPKLVSVSEYVTGSFKNCNLENPYAFRSFPGNLLVFDSSKTERVLELLQKKSKNLKIWVQ